MMKFEKKLYSIVLAVAMLFALVLPASAKSDDETANIYIAIVDGYDKAVSEAEFFTIKEQIKNGTLDKEAFIEEILAWQYGPVVKEVYDFFSLYAAMPIENDFEIKIEDIKFEKMIQFVALEKMFCPVWKLVEQTHSEAPWKYTTELFGLGSVIPKEYIKRYFKDRCN